MRLEVDAEWNEERTALIISVPVESIWKAALGDYKPRIALTAQERIVHDLLRDKRRNKEIATVLNVSERTAKFHVSNVLFKLGLASRNDVV